MFRKPHSMRKQREFLQYLLEKIPGVAKVYYQPPSTIAGKATKLEYPCIVYNFSNIKHTFGDNSPYLEWTQYSVTVMDYDPESNIPNILRHSKDFYVHFDNKFVMDNLYHWTFTITMTRWSEYSIEEE